MQTLYAWKFTVPGDRWVEDPDDPTTSWRGMLTIVVHATEGEARDFARRMLAERGLDSRWLKVARVQRIELDGPALLGVAYV